MSTTVTHITTSAIPHMHPNDTLTTTMALPPMAMEAASPKTTMTKSTKQ